MKKENSEKIEQMVYALEALCREDGKAIIIVRQIGNGQYSITASMQPSLEADYVLQRISYLANARGNIDLFILDVLRDAKKNKAWHGSRAVELFQKEIA